MNISAEDTKNSTKNSSRSKEISTKQSHSKPAVPKTRAKSLNSKATPKIDADTAKLSDLVQSLTSNENFTHYDRIDEIFTRLKHKSAMNLVPFEILDKFVSQVYKNFPASTKIKKNYSKEAKNLTKLLEPLKSYLNLITFAGIDQRLIVDEMTERIFELVKNALQRFIIPLGQNPTKESQKILDSKRCKNCMASICSVLEYMCGLFNRNMFQEHNLLSLSEVLIKTLFAEGAELLHLTCCFTLSGIISSHNKLAVTILNEILNNLNALTDDPNAALGSKSKRINCKDYNVSENIQIKFSTFLVVNIVQHYSSLQKPVRIDGSLDGNQIIIQFEETLGLADKFITEVCSRAFKSRSDAQDYRVYLESFTKDLLKLVFRPEFPIAYQMINLLIIKLFQGLKTFSAIIRHFIIEELSMIGSYLKETIHDIKKSPVVPQQIIKVPMTDHPSVNALASTCICKEGWTANSEMIQCEECWKWFHTDCMGVDPDKYTKESWYCDDCSLFECLQNIRLFEPNVKEDETLSLPKELVKVTQKYKRVYQCLIVNYIIYSGGRLENCSRSVWIGGWADTKTDDDLKILWQSRKMHGMPKLTEKGTSKLIRQYLIVFDLGLSYLHIQSKIISLLNAAQPLTRAKALKSLTSLVQADPDCLSEDMIESAVTEKLYDSSIAVREATVELLGKFITYNSEFSDIYFDNILERLKDKGSSVRKRVIRILKDIVFANPDHERIIQIFCEVVKRIFDDTEVIRDSVIGLFEEFWFGGVRQDLFILVVKVLKVLKCKEPLVQLFKSIILKNSAYKDRLDHLAQTGTEQLVASSSTNNSILYAKILEIVSLSCPELLLDQISTLHQFLTPSNNAVEEAQLFSSICIIIGRTSEFMPSLSQTRIKRIENQLLNLVYTQGSAVLTQALSALCKLVKLCSRNHSIISSLMQKCYLMLKGMSKIKNIETKSQPSLFRAMLALGLSVKFCDKSFLKDLELEEKPFELSVFEVYEKLAQNIDKSIRERALEALSLTWVKFPSILPMCDYLIKNAWQEAHSSEEIIKLLDMFQEFLTSCKEAVSENAEEDTGNVVNVIHGYLDEILASCKNTKIEVRESGAEVLKSIFLQGSVNAGQLIPSLFTMLGDESQGVKEASYFCIEKTFSKSPDLVVVNLKQSLQSAFDLQSVVIGKKQVNTYYPKLYLLIKSKKQLRNKFIKLILEACDCENPEFTEFLCNLLAGFNFTTYEELSPILNFFSGKIQTNALRLLRTMKLTVQKHQKISKQSLVEVLETIQFIVLKNYLIVAYGIKSNEDMDGKGIQKSEDLPSFDDEFEEYRIYIGMSEVFGEELVRLKLKYKSLLVNQNSDEIGVRKRVKKVIEVDNAANEVVEC